MWNNHCLQFHCGWRWLSVQNESHLNFLSAETPFQRKDAEEKKAMADTFSVSQHDTIKLRFLLSFSLPLLPSLIISSLLWLYTICLLHSWPGYTWHFYLFISALHTIRFCKNKQGERSSRCVCCDRLIYSLSPLHAYSLLMKMKHTKMRFCWHSISFWAVVFTWFTVNVWS